MRYTSPYDDPVHLRARIESLENEMREREAGFQRMMEEPQLSAHVLEIRGTKVFVALGAQFAEVRMPAPNVVPRPIEEGDAVYVTAQTKGIIGIIDDPVIAGIVVPVVGLLDDRHVEVKVDPQNRKVVLTGKLRGKLEIGDEVVLDSQSVLVVRKMPKKDVAKPVDTGVSFDDIGGLEDVKALVREAIETHVVDAARARRYGLKRTKGMLLYGPPGGGKTLISKAIATHLATLHGQDYCASAFTYVKGPEVLNMFQGNSEKALRDLFAASRKHFAQHGYPAVICFDEADGLFSRRGMRPFSGSDATIVPTVLAEMDGVEDSGAFVIAITNRPDVIDDALVREGRLDLKVEIPRPTEAECYQILKVQFRGAPVANAGDDLARIGVDELFDRRHRIRRQELRDRVSGAMCAGLVQRAKKSAMRRERASGIESGVSREDIARAGDELCDEQKGLDAPESGQHAKEKSQDGKLVLAR